MMVLLVASGLQIYFSFQVQQNYVLQNQRLIAQNTANTVENFIHEKFSILETTAKRRGLVLLPGNEQEVILERLMGLEPAFRQLILYNDRETEMIKVSRISVPLSSRSMNCSREELFHIASKNEQYVGPVYIDDVTRIKELSVPSFFRFVEKKCLKKKPPYRLINTWPMESQSW